MKRTWLPLLLCSFLAAAPALNAGPYDRVLCPITKGEFLLVAGQLWFEITKENDKPVEKRREQVANPLDERSHEVLAKRGRVAVETHPDKNGGLFVHWGTLRDEE